MRFRGEILYNSYWVFITAANWFLNEHFLKKREQLLKNGLLKKREQTPVPEIRKENIILIAQLKIKNLFFLIKSKKIFYKNFKRKLE